VIFGRTRGWTLDTGCLVPDTGLNECGIRVAECGIKIQNPRSKIQNIMIYPIVTESLIRKEFPKQLSKGK